MIVFLDHVDSLTIDHAQRKINSSATTLHNKSEKNNIFRISWMLCNFEF